MPPTKVIKWFKKNTRKKKNNRIRMGNSKITPRKEECFRSALTMTMILSNGSGGKLSEYPFWYIDMNCGSGYNVEQDCNGSPLEFLGVANKLNRKFIAYFCDKDRESINSLTSNLTERNLYPAIKPNEIFISCKNNRLILDDVSARIKSQEIPKYAVGAILCDPNGTSPNLGFPVDRISEFSKDFKRIDVILNINITSFKRNRGAINGNVSAKWRETSIGNPQKITDVIMSIHKDYWWIKEPHGNGHKFTILVGRNYRDANEKKHLGFHYLESKRGREIVNWCDSD